MSDLVLDEVAVLSAIYCGKDEFELLEETAETGFVFRIRVEVEFEGGASAAAAAAAANERRPRPPLICLLIRLPPGYPRLCPPELSVSEGGLSRSQALRLRQVLLRRAAGLLGSEPMVHRLLLWLRHQDLSDLLLLLTPDPLLLLTPDLCSGGELTSELSSGGELTPDPPLPLLLTSDPPCSSGELTFDLFTASGERRRTEEEGEGEGGGREEEGGKEEEEVWTCLLVMDHMRARRRYVRQVEAWAASLGLGGRLLFLGRLILLLLQGGRGAVKACLRLLRTVQVDVDSSGRRCRERMMRVLRQGPTPRPLHLISEFEVKELSSRQDLQREFEDVGQSELFQEFVPALL